MIKKFYLNFLKKKKFSKELSKNIDDVLIHLSKTNQYNITE